MKNFAAQLILVAAIVLSAFCAPAQTTNDLSDAEIQGRELAQQYLQQKPTANAEQTGVLKIYNGKTSTNLFLKCRIIAASTNWFVDYVVSPATNLSTFLILSITRNNNSTNGYALYKCYDGDWNEACLAGINLVFDVSTPFAGSDFWIGDLGLEFFHWPEQKILKHEMRRGRACRVLESTNPDPSTNGYSRVLTWIDNDTGGIVHAEAYDFKNKLLKVFDPKEFKKVNGQWTLQEMEIRNVQTGSRTRMEFDLPQK